ncbi:alpha-tubulin N-acetyltransferase 1 isoform X7 [Clinocottus analis]|uniref:alpha-tubulin N-acetyltransferase 1 isoform X7 n=1 Tax=Clinocottus analis TaxID=304258 RepID=UPI0035BF8C75
MDFPFDVNQVFSERVSILDQTLAAGRNSAATPHLQAHTATVIDELGRASAKHKHLEPVLMAYDRPSPKFLSFLAKHYCLTPSVPQANNFVVFEGFFLNRSAAQCRKVPPRKPDGEIKPYSLMEREVVLQERRARPWPFAPPRSPQRSGSSQCSHSLSVGSSPSRAPPSPAPGGSREQSPQCPLIERCRARRSSRPGLVARSSLYSRHMDSRAAALLDRPLPGLRPVGNQSHALGDTDTHRLTSIHTSQSRQTSSDCTEELLDSRGAEEELGVLDSLPCPAQGMLVSQRLKEGQGWSWTVGENCYTAQWVKQKQEHRSTRPW